MFCSNCGKEITENSKFCPHCGSAVNQIEETKTRDVAQGNGLLDKLSDCKIYFSQISALYDFHRIGSKLINNTVWIKKVNSKFTEGIICLLLGVITFIPTFKYIIENEWVPLIFLWEVVIAEIVFAIVGGVMTLIYKKHKSTIAFYKEKMPVIDGKIADYYNKYSDCPISIEYSDPNTIERIISYLNSGRAENIKEAINVYEDECHKEQMITEMKQMKAVHNKLPLLQLSLQLILCKCSTLYLTTEKKQSILIEKEHRRGVAVSFKLLRKAYSEVATLGVGFIFALTRMS